MAGRSESFRRRASGAGGAHPCRHPARRVRAVSRQFPNTLGDPPALPGRQQARIRVLSVDDHHLLREGISKIINDQPDMVVVAQATSGGEAIQQFRRHRPDVTLLDLKSPDIHGIDVLVTIRAEFCDPRIAMLTTAQGDVEIQRALEAGAWACILKSASPQELTQAIRQVHAGKKCVPAEVAARLL
ncbi:MAG: response regulator transcription factor [Bryobacteraceae bacterium]